MKRYPPAEHRTILFADVEKFGDPARTNPHQLAVRDAIYRATERAFSRAKVSPDDCLVLDRGDGFLTLIRPHVPKNAVVTRLPGLLAAELVRHNARCDTPERIRLRVALHAGEVNYDDHGVTSRSIIDAYRLLEAPAFKSALASSTGVLGLIVSEWFYREVVSQNPEAEPGTYVAYGSSSTKSTRKGGYGYSTRQASAGRTTMRLFLIAIAAPHGAGDERSHPATGDQPRRAPDPPETSPRRTHARIPDRGLTARCCEKKQVTSTIVYSSPTSAASSRTLSCAAAAPAAITRPQAFAPG